MDRHDGQSGCDQRIHEQPRRPFDRDPQTLAQAREPSGQLCESLGIVSHFEGGNDRSAIVDHTHGVHLAGPVDPGKTRHGHSFRIRSRHGGARGSCRSLIGRRSGFTSVALHPVAGRDLLAPASLRVSSGLLRSQRAWQSRQGRSDLRSPHHNMAAGLRAEVGQ